jgi:hypothetical protein
MRRSQQGCAFYPTTGERAMSLTKRWLDEMQEQGEIIFAYTDEMALDDGVLVDISSLGLSFESKPINRITGNLFWQERPKYPLSEDQLAKHLTDCGDDEEPINFDLETFAKAITEKLTQVGGHDYLRTLPDDIWLVENETGGWTLMLPSDY